MKGFTIKISYCPHVCGNPISEFEKPIETIEIRQKNQILTNITNASASFSGNCLCTYSQTVYPTKADEKKKRKKRILTSAA
jgi:hypothetical protein